MTVRKAIVDWFKDFFDGSHDESPAVDPDAKEEDEEQPAEPDHDPYRMSPEEEERLSSVERLKYELEVEERIRLEREGPGGHDNGPWGSRDD